MVVYSGHWAQQQTESFVSRKQNPELWELLKEGVQKVEINVEEQRGRAAMVYLFTKGLRKRRAKEHWGRYFVVSRGLTDNVRSYMGYVNRKVGYVYLVDWKCRIRWAGSGEAEEGEKEGLAAGAKRLLEVWRKGKEAEK